VHRKNLCKQLLLIGSKNALSRANEVVVKEGYYSIDDTIENLYVNNQAKAILEEFFHELHEAPYFEGMKSMFTIEKLAIKSMFQMPLELLGIINNQLNVIPYMSTFFIKSVIY
jgi:hypothetical protein